MVKEKKGRSQLNINIEPELLLRLKSEAIKSGLTLTEFVTNQLQTIPHETREEVLEKRLLRIENQLAINTNQSNRKGTIGTIFTDEGASEYGAVAKKLFELHFTKKRLTRDAALQELAFYLNKHEHSDPELVFQILIGSHDLTGLEMTGAYRLGSCAMRTALSEWSEDPLEELNRAFLDAVITKSLN